MGNNTAAVCFRVIVVAVYLRQKAMVVYILHITVTGASATRTAVALCCNGNVAVCCGNRAVAVCCGRALWLSAVPHHDDCLLWQQHCGQNYVAVCCLYTPRDTRESLPAGFLPPLSAPFLSLYPSSLSLQIIGTDETSIRKVNGHIFAKRLQFVQSTLSTKIS